MSARDTILATIRRSLKAEGDEAGRRQAVEARLAAPPSGIVPKRGQLPHEEQVALFAEMATAVDATVERVAGPGQVTQALSRFLRERNLPQAVVRGTDPYLAGLDWESVPHLRTKTGIADGSEEVGLSHAFAGVAESGTAVLLSGPENPTTVNFLPETHVIVVEARDIVGDYEAMWSRLRDRFGRGTMPRTVNMVTGPSRSADIEQTLLLGAHGPRRLHLIVVDTP
ncbi:LutC/YkgG family protein [Lutibaculum baratangense]|uniref:LUD domain-containing protein n=1 Tax=Lutibaculum baratangense AMV1 TaxID=631454 RepID=V4RHF9_9HYPH|nr:lactate utilization protein [Lutibaculum baratangense]ESR25556.1 putative L-lactate dehydrogenase, hypothetical protein subunit YkgG [Lutibaculum baratangense AMV1]